MTRQRYIPGDNQWVTYPKFDKGPFIEAVYDEVGGVFPLSIRSDGHVLFDPSDLPDGLSENDVKQAVRDNHPHRK